MGERIDRFKSTMKVAEVKAHFQRNQKVYITGAVCLVVGALVARQDGDANNALVRPKIFALKAGDIMQDIDIDQSRSTVVVVPPRGHRGNIIVDNTTGTPYPSQNAAAQALGVSASTLARHLQGKRDHVDGHTFTNLGENLGEEVVVSAA